jgi:hypothetical protein
LPSRDHAAVRESLSRTPEPTPSRVVLSWPYRAPDTLPRERPIPLVDGRPVREATLALHKSGFRVSLKGFGRVSRTTPTAGETAKVGTTVVVWTE